MENFILSFNVVTPLFLIMSLGYYLKYIKLLDKQTLNVMNSVCFKIFLPILLFFNIYQSDVKSSFNINLIIFSVSSIVILFIILCFLIPKIEKDNKKRGVMIQGIFRSNFVIFGMPIATSKGERKVVPESDGEKHYWESETWFYIDKKNRRLTD